MFWLVRFFLPSTTLFSQDIHHRDLLVDQCLLTPLRANIGGGYNGFLWVTYSMAWVDANTVIPPAYLSYLLVFSEGIMW